MLILCVPVVDEKVKGDEFWDYDQQVDLEGFTSGRLYGILAKQSREVTAAIARQKDQVIIININIKDNKTSFWKRAHVRILNR